MICRQLSGERCFRVDVIGIGTGTVVNTRQTINGPDGVMMPEPLYTVQLDESDLTPCGLFYARKNEIRIILR